MYLKTLIEALEKADQAHIAPLGFGHAMSYRGDYSQLAFNPETNVKVADMLHIAKAAVGETFEGYKGGDFKMTEWVDCYICRYGESGGDKIGPVLVAYMTGKA